MSRRLPPRLRPVAILVLASIVVVAILGATHGWGTVPAILPIPIVVGVWLYVDAGRETDYGPFLRRELDERQRLQRLRAQALTGRVLAIGLTVGYVIALATRSTVWPWAVGVGVGALTFIGGFISYGEGGRTTRDR